MKKIRLFSLLVGILALISFWMAACTPAGAPPLEEAGELAVEPASLRVAMIPVLDGLPIYVSQEEGLFAERGLQVEIIPVSSAPERDQLIAAGQADGMINETVSTLFNNRETTEVQIVRYARTATSETPLFRILASAESGIVDAQGLKGVEIGISQGTVIEYLTDRLLEKQNFSADEIKTIAVPKISDRMALLSNGEIPAAMLPEPLSSLAVLQGATIALDDTTYPEVSYSTIAFRKTVIDENPDAVRSFLDAVEVAVTQINDEPDRWTDLLKERQLVPEPVLETFQVPAFPTAGVPTEAQWQDALEWARAKGLIDVDVSYAESVNATLLP